ncbi:hypothetical protein [Lysobacter gummosus]|uniref:hypothetical protein n=1 Tax=Lysobacter gummosus TaxID=262324 RepID=UPI003642555F
MPPAADRAQDHAAHRRRGDRQDPFAAGAVAAAGLIAAHRPRPRSGATKKERVPWNALFGAEMAVLRMARSCARPPNRPRV